MQHEPSIQFRVHEIGSSPSLLARRIPAGLLVAGLLGYFGLSQLLLWRFLGIASLGAYAVGTALMGLACWSATKASRDDRAADPIVATFVVALGAAMALFLLGGEGRLFYANIDWQVRDAVLHDMAVNPWPFVYAADGGPSVLRAPLGMYFVPALAFKQFGAAVADWTMLFQNSLLLATLLTLASTLFGNVRHRLIALGVFTVFSGLDAIGAFASHRWSDHLDAWAGTEFSSTITLAFWAPQHAMAGWAAALAYLLWSKGQQSIRFLLALLPLMALWSPLALIGSVPFAGLAAGRALIRRELRPADLLAPSLALLLCLPSLAYLRSASQSVGAGRSDVTPAQFAFFQLVETLPYLLPLAFVVLRERSNRAAMAVAAACLFAAPWFRIGASVDFASRATIPALAILACLTARTLLAARELAPAAIKAWLAIALLIGSVTGYAELARALGMPVGSIGPTRGRCLAKLRASLTADARWELT